MSIFNLARRAVKFVVNNLLPEEPKTQTATTPLTTSQPAKAAEQPVVAIVEPQTATTAEAPASSTPPVKPEEVKTATAPTIKPPTGKVAVRKERCMGCPKYFFPTRPNINYCPACSGSQTGTAPAPREHRAYVPPSTPRPEDDLQTEAAQQLLWKMRTAIGQRLVQSGHVVSKRPVIEDVCAAALKEGVYDQPRSPLEVTDLEQAVVICLTQLNSRKYPDHGQVMTDEEAAKFVAARRPKVVAPAAAQKSIVAPPQTVQLSTKLDEKRLIEQAIRSFEADKGLPEGFTLKARNGTQLVFLLPNGTSITKHIPPTPAERAAKQAAEKAAADEMRANAAIRATADRKAAELKKLREGLLATYIARRTLPEGVTATVDPKDTTKVTFEFTDGRSSITATLPKTEKKTKGEKGDNKHKGKDSSRKAA